MKHLIHKTIALSLIISALAPLSAYAAIDATSLSSLRTLPHHNFSPIIGMPSGEDAATSTRSAISDGTIEVRGNKDENLASLSRDTDNAHQKLEKIFDAQKIAEQQELARIFGQEANKLVGDVCKQLKWENGSYQKILLHTLVGALQAQVGGGNIAAGALGGLASEAAVPMMEKILKANDIQKGTPEYDSLMKIASAIVGGAVGAIVSGDAKGVGSGASTALANIENNYLKHPEIKQKVKLDEQCARGNDQACKDAQELQKTSDDRDKALKSACEWNGDPTKCGELQQEVRSAYADIIRYGSKDLFYGLYAEDSKMQADSTMSMSDRLLGTGAGYVNSFVDGLVGLGKGLGTAAAALAGYEEARKDTGDFFKQLANDPGRVAAAMVYATPEQREKLAQAYERGDAYEIGKVGGEILSNTPIGGGVGTIGKIGKAGKIADEIGDVGKVGKAAEKIGSAEKVAKGDSLILRAQYEADVRQLEDLALNARAAGTDVEATARMVHAERNALKDQYRALSPPEKVLEFEQRNIEKYGNPLGPTIEQLRAQGKTWEQIIESAARPGGADLGF